MRSIAQKFAKLFGAVYVLVGVIGFLSVAGGTASQAPSLLLGIFGVTFAHNIAHLAIGAAFLVGSYSPKSARITCVTIGAAYVLLGTVGLLEYQSVDELLNINQADNILHFATGLLAIMFGLVDVPVAEAKQRTKRVSRSEIKARKVTAAAPVQESVVGEAPVTEQLQQPVNEPAEVFAAAAAAPPAPAPKAPRESRKARKARQAEAVQVSATVADAAAAPVPAPAPEVPVAGPAPAPVTRAPRESRKARKARETESASLAAAAVEVPLAPVPIPAPLQGSTNKIKWESRSARNAREAQPLPMVESAQSWISGDGPESAAESGKGGPWEAAVPAPEPVAQQPESIVPEPTQELAPAPRQLSARELSREAQRTAKATRKARKAASTAPAPAVPVLQSAQAPNTEIAEAIKSIQAPVSAVDRKAAKRASQSARKARKAGPPAAESTQGIGPEMEQLDSPVLVGGPPALEKTQELPTGNS